MEISILLTILFMIVSLCGTFFLGGKLCLIGEVQIDADSVIKYIVNNSFYLWAVKLILGDLYLLNTVAFSDIQNAAQVALIQLKNHIIEG